VRMPIFFILRNLELKSGVAQRGTIGADVECQK
jgi:hypothetical protein